MRRSPQALSVLSLWILASAVSAEQYTGGTTAVWLESSSLPIPLSSSFHGQQNGSNTSFEAHGPTSRILLQTDIVDSIFTNVASAVKGASTGKTPPPPPPSPSPAPKVPSPSPAKTPSPSPVITPAKSPSPVPQPSPSPSPKTVAKSPAPIPPSPSPVPSPVPSPSASPSPSPLPLPSPSPSPLPSPTVAAKPITTLPGEVLPDALKPNASSSDPVILVTEKVTVTMVLKGVLDLEANLKITTAVTATMSGTSAAQWTVSNSTLLLVALTGSRRLQQQQQDVSIGLAIVTTNPQLVVFRLSQAPLPASAAAVQANSPAGSTSSVQGNCMTEYCLRLAAAGIPVDTAFGIKVTPVYDFSSSNADTAAAVAARDAEVARSRTVGVAVGVSLAVAVVLLLLLCNARRILACWRNRAAGKLQATGDGAEAAFRNRWLLLSWTGAAATSTSNVGPGAASATAGAANPKNPTTADLSSKGGRKVLPASWLARVSVGSGASHTSSTIGTMPIAGAVPAKQVAEQPPQVPEHGPQETLDVASYWDDQHEASSNSGSSNGQHRHRSMRSVFRSGSFRRPASQCGVGSHAGALSAAGVESAPSVDHMQAATALAAGDDWFDCRSDPGSVDRV